MINNWRQYLGRSLESVLLGMVDAAHQDPLLHVSPRADNSGIYRRRGAGTGPGVHPLVCHYKYLGLHLGMDGTLSVAQLADIVSLRQDQFVHCYGQYPGNDFVRGIPYIVMAHSSLLRQTPVPCTCHVLIQGDLNPKNGRKVLWALYSLFWLWDFWLRED